MHPIIINNSIFILLKKNNMVSVIIPVTIKIKILEPRRSLVLVATEWKIIEIEKIQSKIAIKTKAISKLPKSNP